MDADDWTKQSTQKLELAGVTTARLDTLVLLEDATGKDRAWLLAHPEHILQGQVLKDLQSQVERRANHEPLAYIRGKSEFYGREFLVNKHTLEPRPESETIVELLKTLVSKDQPWTIIDVGTGSGCLAITTKLELPESTVLATDIDEKCIRVAEQNAKQHNANIKLCQGNLLEPFLQEFDPEKTIVVANLPYVPNDHAINRAATFEPKHAIFGGKDGLDLYRNMFEQLQGIKNIPVCVLTESLPTQHDDLAKVAEKSGYAQLKKDDFIQVFIRS